jgi:hypothetical protein
MKYLKVAQNDDPLLEEAALVKSSFTRHFGLIKFAYFLLFCAFFASILLLLYSLTCTNNANSMQFTAPIRHDKRPTKRGNILKARTWRENSHNLKRQLEANLMELNYFLMNSPQSSENDNGSRARKINDQVCINI